MRLRLIKEGDLELLRIWKNENKGAFFHQEDITVDQQKNWFKGYKSRDLDFMFIVEEGKEAIGCMGIRHKGEEWDVYNVILGLKKYGKRGIMSEALQKLIKNAMRVQYAPVTVKVLKGNEQWYEKNGFKEKSDGMDYTNLLYEGGTSKK